MKQKIFPIIGIVVGVISIIMSFIVKGMNYSNYVYSTTYGGDAYTGIQNAAASTANNVGMLTDLVAWGSFAILFVFGLACIAFFGMKLMEILESNAYETEEGQNVFKNIFNKVKNEETDTTKIAVVEELKEAASTEE